MITIIPNSLLLWIILETLSHLHAVSPAIFTLHLRPKMWAKDTLLFHTPVRTKTEAILCVVVETLVHPGLLRWLFVWTLQPGFGRSKAWIVFISLHQIQELICQSHASILLSQNLYQAWRVNATIISNAPPCFECKIGSMPGGVYEAATADSNTCWVN